MEKSIAKFPVKHWNQLKTKEELYTEFDGMEPGKRNYILATGNKLDCCYADSEFEKVAEKLENAAKDLRPLLLDIENHFAVGTEYKQRAQAVTKKFLLDNNVEIATLALVIFNALDNTNEESFINRIRTGNGIPEERAAYRAGKRYQAFKAADAARLEAFKNTPEYALQEAELKFKRREKIELPEE